MTDIRPLRREDIPALIDLGQELHPDTSFAEIPFVAADVRRYLEMCLGSEMWTCFVADRDGAILGGMNAKVYPFYFNASCIGSADGTLYVSKGARGMLLGKRLIDACRAWAFAKGALQFSFAIYTGVHDIDRIGRMLERMGYQLTGGTYMLRRPQ